MTVFFNWPDRPDRAGETNPSRVAGAAIGRALSAIMVTLEEFETGQQTRVRQAVRFARNQLRGASDVFTYLEGTVPEAHLYPPPRLRNAFVAANGLLGELGGIQSTDFIGPVTGEVPPRALMHLATSLTDKLARQLSNDGIDLHNAQTGRMIATNAIALQVFGLLVSEIIADALSPGAS